ncbi:MAG TPA: hypothetical protein VII85_01805 [Candidatus Krumholzibacteriaceae bacterium]
MKKVLTLGAALVLMVFLSASMLVAQDKAAREKGKASSQKEMKLSDEQKAKIKEMRMDLRLKMVDLRAEREKVAIMLGKEMMKPEPSMDEIQGLVKRLSETREKIQLTAIENLLAMRKFLGPEWRSLMRGQMREHAAMMDEPGMAGADEERDVTIMRRPMRGMGERGGMMNMRTMRIRGGEAGEETGEESGEAPGMMMMRRPGMGEEKGGCTMMQKSGMGAGGGMGEMKGGCMMMQKGGACCSNKSGNWHRMMFRPYGKGSCCGGMGGCMMHKGGMSAMKGGCKETGCMKGGAAKQEKCKVEVRIEKKD